MNTFAKTAIAIVAVFSAATLRHGAIASAGCQAIRSSRFSRSSGSWRGRSN